MEIGKLLNVTGLDSQKIQQVNQTLEKQSIDFSKLMVDALEKVNLDQYESQLASSAFLVGESDNIHDVKIAGMKAELSLNLAVEVTNKIISAYNEIMRLQL